MRGIGPATASLLLSVAYEDTVPFFADEILGWLREGKDKAQGKLKYDWKEYKEVWEGVRRVHGGLDTGEGRRVSAEDVERGAWVVEMVKEMGLESAAVAEEEEKSGAIGKGEDAGGLQAGDVDSMVNAGIEDEDNDIHSAKDAGKQDKRASARQKRKIPPSVSPPAATRKKSKKASKSSTRIHAGEHASSYFPRELADANEGDGSRRLP